MRAFGRDFPVAVVDGQGVDVLRRHLSAFQLGQQSSGYVNSSHEGRADVRGAVAVHPAVLFWHRQQVSKGHVALSHHVADLFQLPVLCSESLVEGLSEDLLDWRLPKSLEVAEHGEHEIYVKHGRQVVLGSVDPAHEEVVVTIRISFHTLEELCALGYVELGP